MRTRRLAAALLLVGIVVGVAVVLVAIARWPLPTGLPDWDRVVTAFRQGDLPAIVVIKALACVVWVCWALLVWALAWETWAQLRHPHDPPAQHPVPLVPRRVHLGVGRLVAFVLAAAVAVATPARSLAAPTGATVVASAPPAPPPADASTALVPAASSVWVVAEGDTVWDIAEVALGDGGRTSEILERNPRVTSPRMLRVGQELRLPADAAIPDSRRPAPTEAPVEQVQPSATVVVEAPGYVPAGTITVRTGDNLWDLSEARLDQADGPDAQPSAALVADYLGAVIQTNAFPSGNPSLIYAGEQYTFPAVGQPPPLSPSPTLPVSPDPSAPADPEPAPDSAAAPPSTAPLAPPSPPIDRPTVGAQPAPPVTSSPHITPTDAATSGEPGRDDRTPVAAGIAGATVLATGLLLTYRRRRRRAGIAGARRLSRPLTTPQADLVDALVRTADVPLVRWANHELATLMTRLNPARVTGTPLVVELSTRHGIELLWDSPQGDAPAPWEAADTGWTWRLLYDPDHPIPRQPEIPPLAGLATVGTRDGNTVLVNLEALGTIAVTGDPASAEDLVRAVVLELGATEELANVCTTIVGVTIEGDEHLWRTEHGDSALAINRLRSVQDSYRALLDETGLATAFQTRLGDTSGDGEIYLAAVNSVSATEVLDHVPIEPNLGAAMLVLGDSPAAKATIAMEASGRATLHPLGLTFEAVGLPLSTASAIAVLLDEADLPELDASTPDDPAPAPGCDGDIHAVLGADDPDAFEDLGPNHAEEDPSPLDEPTHLIRVLGVPRIEGVERVGPLELGIVTFLACSGGAATRDQVINAIWGGKAIERGTFLNRLTKTRNALPGILLGRANGTRDLALAEGVTTDLHLLEQLVGRSRQASSGEAIELLTQALALVEGVPFDHVHFDWAHDRQHHAHACQLIEQAALKLVELALDHDDIDLAREACRRGLVGLPLNEPVYCARMRVEFAAGNRSGIQDAFRDLCRGLSELDDCADTYAPSAETVRLHEQLAGTTRLRHTA